MRLDEWLIDCIRVIMSRGLDIISRRKLGHRSGLYLDLDVSVFILAVSNAEGTYYRYLKLMYLQTQRPPQ